MPTPSTTIEIEIRLDGKVSRYRPATQWDPAEGGEVYDLDISDVGALSYVPPRATGLRPDWKFTSLLTGVDVNNPEVRKLLDNLLEAVREDAEYAVAKAA